MANQNHRKALLDAFNGKEVLIETIPQEVLSLMGIKDSSHPLLAFFDEDLLPEGVTHTRSLQITIKCMGAKVPMVFIDNGSTLNVCPYYWPRYGDYHPFSLDRKSIRQHFKEGCGYFQGSLQDWAN